MPIRVASVVVVSNRRMKIVGEALRRGDLRGTGVRVLQERTHRALLI